MNPKIKSSSILEDYHVNVMKEHKMFLRMLETRARDEAKLRKQYDEIPVRERKKRKAQKAKLPVRPRGRPRRCFDMETAKEIVRAEGIGSVVQYKHWFAMNSPAKMPKNPSRAYKSQWTGWGDFLGVYNDYGKSPLRKTNGSGKFRSFEDARLFARSLRLKSMNDWKEYIKTGACPADIPLRPDYVYSKGKRTESWLSWKNFLGYDNKNTIVDAISSTAPVLYIAKNNNRTLFNVYVINVIPGGRSALVDHLNKVPFKLIRAYYVDSKFNHRSIISELTVFDQDEYNIPNLFELIEIFDNNLEKVV